MTQLRFVSRMLLLAAGLFSAGCATGDSPPEIRQGAGNSTSPGGSLARVDPQHVCMYHDSVFEETQIPVLIDGETYYAASRAHVRELNMKPGARIAIDPVSGHAVNKAEAVIGSTPDGTIYYFESSEHMNTFESYLSRESHAATNGSLEIRQGAGSFTIAGGNGREERDIEVHYYKPSSFSESSPIVMVMPGGGRNGDEYRNTWMKSAERFGLLVVAPSFSEQSYPGPLNYNLARMISSADRRALSGMIVREDPNEWIFSDFDRIFRMIKEAVDSCRSEYDVFGHSAGGQLAHRLAIFYPEAEAGTIMAANSGWYTVATFDEPFPYGLKDAPIPPEQLEEAFSEELVVFLGELDDASETRGHLRETPGTNEQGPGRLERGLYFYETSRDEAARLNLDFAWELETVPDVGHSYREMGAAAAEYLYGLPSSKK